MYDPASQEKVHIGVLRLVLRIPGARSRKDRRQAIRSLADRMRHRFDVTVNEIDRGEQPTMAILVVTTAGNDGRLIRSILDQATAFAETVGLVGVVGIDVDVFRWHPPGIEDLFDLESEDG